MATNDPIDIIETRRASMNDILGSWNLEGALPDESGMEVIREYVDGGTTLAEALEKMEALTPKGADRG